MADIINLRRARKNKQREDKEIVAAANRLKFGEAKHDRKLQDALKQQADAKLNSHKRSDPE